MEAGGLLGKESVPSSISLACVIKIITSTVMLGSFASWTDPGSPCSPEPPAEHRERGYFGSEGSEPCWVALWVALSPASPAALPPGFS